MPIQKPDNYQEWYDVQGALAEVVPHIVRLKELLAKTGDEEDDDTKELTKMIEDEETRYIELMKRSLNGHAPMRDLIIRNKCFAFSRQHMDGGTGDEDVYMPFFQRPEFGYEYKLLQMALDKEQMDEQIPAGYDLDLSHYMETVSAVCCNKLLNLAAGNQDLKEWPKDHPWSIKLKKQTAELEERKLWDEFWLIRMGIIHTFGIETGVYYQGQEEREEFILAADKILSEEYQKGFREPVEQA